MLSPKLFLLHYMFSFSIR